MGYLHLFKKLSMLLFFLRAGKSRSYTNASKPSCRGKKANKATIRLKTLQKHVRKNKEHVLSVSLLELDIQHGLHYLSVGEVSLTPNGQILQLLLTKNKYTVYDPLKDLNVAIVSEICWPLKCFPHIHIAVEV